MEGKISEVKVMRRITAFMASAMVGILLLTMPVMAADGSQPEKDRGPGYQVWLEQNNTADKSQTANTDTKEKLTGPGVHSAENNSQENSGQEAQAQQAQQEAQAQQAQQEAQAQQAQQEAQAQAQQEAQAQQAQQQAAAQSGGRVIDPNKPMIALTFDDGPYAPVGNQIMDCLAQYGGKVTFYVVGNRCTSYAAEMKRMAAEGHEIGNHTYEHKYLNKLNAAQIQYQINKGIEAIEAVSGVRPATVRLPGGSKNATVLANVKAPMIMWNVDTRDWKTKNTKQTVNAVLGKVKDGDVVLMHELYVQSGNAAIQIIPALVEQGYQLVTVSELAQYRGGLQSGKVYYNFK